MFYRKVILKNACLDISESHFYMTKITNSWGLNEINVILSITGPKRASLLRGVFAHSEAFWFGIFHSEYSDESIRDHVGYIFDYETADQVSRSVDSMGTL